MGGRTLGTWASRISNLCTALLYMGGGGIWGLNRQNQLIQKVSVPLGSCCTSLYSLGSDQPLDGAVANSQVRQTEWCSQSQVSPVRRPT